MRTIIQYIIFLVGRQKICFPVHKITDILWIMLTFCQYIPSILYRNRNGNIDPSLWCDVVGYSRVDEKQDFTNCSHQWYLALDVLLAWCGSSCETTWWEQRHGVASVYRLLILGVLSLLWPRVVTLYLKVRSWVTNQRPEAPSESNGGGLVWG